MIMVLNILRESKLFNNIESLALQKYISVAWFIEYAETQFELNLAKNDTVNSKVVLQVVTK